MATKRKLKGRKKAMYDALKSQLGIVTTAAKKSGIDRTTHYLWLKKDKNYKAWVEDIPEETHDFVENALLKQIKNGNVTSMIFYLKNKAKHRGWAENYNIDANVKNSLSADTFIDLWKEVKEKEDKSEEEESEDKEAD